MALSGKTPFLIGDTSSFMVGFSIVMLVFGGGPRQFPMELEDSPNYNSNGKDWGHLKDGPQIWTCAHAIPCG